MNPRTLTTLGIAAGVVALVAIVVSFVSNDRTDIATSGEPFYPGLLDKVNDAQRIVVSTAGESLTIERDGDEWSVAELDGYPARFENVRRLLLEVANLKKREPRTSNPELYSRIQVEDISEEDAQSKEVRVYGPGGENWAALLVGSRRFGQGMSAQESSFVRAVGDPQSWLVEGAVDVNTGRTSWIDTQLIRFPANEVQRVEIAHRDGERVVINKPDPDQRNFDLETLPEGREVSSPTRPNELGGLLSSLRFDEVRPADSMELPPNPNVTVTVEGKEGITITARGWERADQTWFRFAAEVDGGKIESVNASRLAAIEEATGEEDIPGELELIDAEAVGERVAGMAKKFDAWVYRLPSFSRDRFFRRNEYYLKSLEEEAPDDGEEEWLIDAEPVLESPNGFDTDEEQVREALEQLLRDENAELPDELREALEEQLQAPATPGDTPADILLPGDPEDAGDDRGLRIDPAPVLE